MSDEIKNFDDRFDYVSDEEYNVLSDDKKKDYYTVTYNGVTKYAKPKQKLDTGIPSAGQANVVKDEGEAQREKEIEEGKKIGEEVLKEDYKYGGDRYGTEEAASAIGKSKAGIDVWESTAIGSKGELNKAALEKQKNIEELDKSDRYKLLIEDVKTARKLGKEGGSFYVREKQGVTINGKPEYEIVIGEQGDIKNAQNLNNRSFSSEEEAKKYIDKLQDAIYNDKNIRYFGDKYTKDDSEVKTKSGAIEDALKYRGIGYLNYLRKKGVIDDAEYEKYKNQIQEVRDIRKPGIAKALNTAYLIYNAIANGFRNMGNLAFNVAGKGQVQYSQSALGNMLENAFEKAQEVNVAREKGAMEDVFDWQKSKRGLVLDSEKAFRDWGIKARENWSEWDRQTATNVISSFLLKDQKAFDEYMRRTGYAWDKTFAADFGHYLEKKTDAEKQEFISGLFMQAGDNPDALVKMLLSAYTTLPRDAAMKYFFGNKVAEDFVEGAELNDNDVFRKAEAELKRAGYKGAELRKKLDEFIISWNSMKNKKQDKENKQEKEKDKKNKNNTPKPLNPEELEGYEEGKTVDRNKAKEIEEQAKKDTETAKQTGSFRKGK